MHNDSRRKHFLYSSKYADDTNFDEIIENLYENIPFINYSQIKILMSKYFDKFQFRESSLMTFLELNKHANFFINYFYLQL